MYKLGGSLNSVSENIVTENGKNGPESSVTTSKRNAIFETINERQIPKNRIDKDVNDFPDDVLDKMEYLNLIYHVYEI